MGSTADRLRELADRARQAMADARAARDERNALILARDAEGARLREIAAAAGMSVAHVQRIIVRLSADQAAELVQQ